LKPTLFGSSIPISKELNSMQEFFRSAAIMVMAVVVLAAGVVVIFYG
jgi:predicted lysophospholipase L1 biosynthesis ABC-type transport system permease subunit